jgi:hypothetical protein
VLDRRRFTTDVERVLFALVANRANRAVDLMGKPSAAEWACQGAAIPGLAAMDEDQAYRAMDLLVEADTAARVQGRCCVAPIQGRLKAPSLLRSDRHGQFVERDRHPAVGRLLGGELVVSAPNVLHERMPRDDHAGVAVLLALFASGDQLSQRPPLRSQNARTAPAIDRSEKLLTDLHMILTKGDPQVDNTPSRSPARRRSGKRPRLDVGGDVAGSRARST